MDYDKVTNPFITLKKMSGDKEQDFTAQLNTAPPNVDNDQYRSNLKESNHSLYSDRREEKLRMGENTNTFENYAITLLDIDNIIYEYFVNVIRPQVLDTAGSVINVPVRHASPEKWHAIQNDGAYRDAKGQIQRPMIIFTRTSVSRDDEFVHFNKYLSVPFVKKFDSKNMYDKFSILNDMQPVYEVHNVTFPDHVILNYDFTMNTDYVEQMNMLVEKINFASDDYWGDPKRLKFRTKIDSFSNSVESSDSDDRNVSTTFSLTVNAYLLPEVFDDRMTVKRQVSKRKVLWGTEAVASDDPRLLGNQDTLSLTNEKKTSFGTKIIILDRTFSELHLDARNSVYDVRMRLDEEFYTIETEDDSFMIRVDNTDKHPVFIWDYERNEVEMRPGDKININVGTQMFELEIDKKSVEMFTIKRI
tara:strand:+ start:1623 stop:2873 length:1251 start_codon:yes stop_codon:yes gene_type:complete